MRAPKRVWKLWRRDKPSFAGIQISFLVLVQSLVEPLYWLSYPVSCQNTYIPTIPYKVNSSPYLNDVAGLPSFSTLHLSPWHSSSWAFFLPIVKLQRRNLRVSFWETIEHYVSFMRPQKEVPWIKELTNLEYCYYLITAAFLSSTLCLRPVQSVAVDTPAKECIMVSSKTFERRKACNNFSGKKKNRYTTPKEFLKLINCLFTRTRITLLILL